MDPRNDRMRLRKNNEEVFRFRLKLEAQEKCKAESNAFGECAKNNVSDCMDKHSTEEDFHKLLKREGVDPASLQKK